MLLLLHLLLLRRSQLANNRIIDILAKRLRSITRTLKRHVERERERERERESTKSEEAGMAVWFAVVCILAEI